MPNIIAENLSSVKSELLIQFLVEPFQLMQNRKKHVDFTDVKYPFYQIKFKSKLNKINWKEHCSNLDPDAVLGHFLQILSKLLDRSASNPSNPGLG